MTSPGSAPCRKGEQAAAGIGRLIEPDGCDVAKGMKLIKLMDLL